MNLVAHPPVGTAQSYKKMLIYASDAVMGMLYNSQRMGARAVRTYIIDRDLAVLQHPPGFTISCCAGGA